MKTQPKKEEPQVMSTPPNADAKVKEFTEKIQALCQEYKLDIRLAIFPLEEKPQTPVVETK